MKMKFFFALCFALAATAARGQIYIDSYRFGAAAGPLFLDEFGNAHTAFSLRKLRNAYTENCIEVLKDSTGDLTQNIGFVNNYLDTAAMKTFCGSNSCRVKTWYDQTGNGRNASEATKENMPTIVNSGTIFYSLGDVAIDFDGTNDRLSIANSSGSYNFFHNGTNSTALIVTDVDVDKFNNLFANKFNDLGSRGVTVDIRTVLRVNTSVMNGVNDGVIIGNISSVNEVAINTDYVIYFHYDADNATIANRSEIYINDRSAIKNNSWTAAINTGNAQGNMFLGATSLPGNFLDGTIKEFIIYDSDKLSSRTSIRDNIKTYYSIY